MESGQKRLSYLTPQISIAAVLIAFWGLGCILLIVFPTHQIQINGTSHTIYCGLQLAINQLTGTFYVDQFFKWITFLGDGWFALILIVLIGFIRFRKAVILCMVTLFASLSSQFLKNHVFENHHRPLFIFNHFDRHEFKHSADLQLHIHNSFPSGHTTQAFAIFIFFALISSRLSIKLFFTALALLVGFSRIYLGQHWTQDVIAGSMIGSFFACLGYWAYLFFKPLHLKFYRKKPA